MAELVDAPGSGPGGRKTVEVRVLFSAPVLIAAFVCESAFWPAGVRTSLEREWMAPHDGVLALRTRRDQIDGHLADLLDAPQVAACRFR